MLYHPKNVRTVLQGLDGKTRSLMVPLIRTPGRPNGGWRTKITIKDQGVEVPGNSPQEVYNNAVRLLSRNNASVPPATLWTTLNINWLQRTPEKYHLVPLVDLLANSRPADSVTDEPKDARKRSYRPQDWGAIAWGWLNLFLARESYSYREFLLQCHYVLDMLNPNTNEALGCGDCYTEFSVAVEELKRYPEWNQQQAREFLVKAHNAVNKRLEKEVLPYDVAAKKAFWA